MRTALAVEPLIDEAAFVVGPVLVTALAAGLVAAIVIIAAAGLAFAAQRSTDPPASGGAQRGQDAGWVRRPRAL